MDTLIEYSFWCWRHKLQGVLQLLSLLTGYNFSETDADEIKQGLYNTNADKNQLFLYNLSTAQSLCQVELGIDEDDRVIVFITVTTPSTLQEQILLLDRIQSSLKTIEIDFA